jgi:hypothetical protein
MCCLFCGLFVEPADFGLAVAGYFEETPGELPMVSIITGVGGALSFAAALYIHRNRIDSPLSQV